MGDYSVYVHTFPDGKHYVGITKGDVEERWKNSFGYKTQYVFTAIVKFGWDNIQHDIIANGLSKQEACFLEKELIEKYDSMLEHNGYNVDLGGTENFHSDATRKKISQSKKGREVSEETRAKHRLAMTPEKKKKMQDASIQKCSKSVRCVETNIVYSSISEASRMTGAEVSAISKCCNHYKRYKASGGYHWEWN